MHTVKNSTDIKYNTYLNINTSSTLDPLKRYAGGSV